MKPTRIAAALLALGTIGVWGNGYAADKADFGKHEYERKCAICHGLEGRGNGAMAAVLKTRVSNLTYLSKNNNGVFPVKRVYDVIDGTEVLPAHGTRDMPIWGTVYREEIGESQTHVYDEVAPAYVRAQILGLIEYINRLQAK
jgi:mono/diheme cytochrome c family protein